VKQKPKKNFGSYMMRLSSSKDAGEGTVIVVNYHTNKDDFKNVRMKNAHESGFVHGSGSKQKHIAVLGEFIGAYPKKLITPVPSPGYIHLEGGHVAFPWIDASRAWALHAAEEKNRERPTRGFECDRVGWFHASYEYGGRSGRRGGRRGWWLWW
jgi:hypothetical protein